MLEMVTARLILRQWRDSDRDAFAALNSDPDVMRHFPAVLSRAESDVLIARAREKWLRERICYWAVEVKGGGFIGFTGLSTLVRCAFHALRRGRLAVGAGGLGQGLCQ